MATTGKEMPTLKLNDGNAVPLLGFGLGTAMSNKSGGTVIDEERISHINTAIKVGFRHLDGAESYGNETEIGEALKRASNIPRSEFFVTTKCWTKSLGDVPKSFDTSLKKLGLDYVDLYLLHAPFVPDEVAATADDKKRVITEAWKSAVALQEEGKARSIGVSNFAIEHLELLRETSNVTPSVNQVEFHLYLQQRKLHEYMKGKGIAMQAYGPLVPITRGSPGPADTLLTKLAEKYGVTEGAVALRWCIDQDVIPISTSSKEERLKDYLKVFKFKLTTEEVKELASAGEGKHFRQFWRAQFPENL